MHYVSDATLEIIREALSKVEILDSGAGRISNKHVPMLRDLIEAFDYYSISGVGETLELVGVVLKEDSHFHLLNVLRDETGTVMLRLDDYLEDYADLSQIHWFLEDVRAEWAKASAQAKAA